MLTADDLLERMLSSSCRSGCDQFLPNLRSVVARINLIICRLVASNVLKWQQTTYILYAILLGCNRSLCSPENLEYCAEQA